MVDESVVRGGPFRNSPHVINFGEADQCTVPAMDKYTDIVRTTTKRRFINVRRLQWFFETITIF